MVTTHALPAVRALRHATLALCGAAALALGPPAAAAGDGDLPTGVRHCAGSDRLEFAADPRVMLERADRDRVHRALVQRFPIVQRQGFGASDFVLWQRGGEEWLYVALGHEGADPTETCYTASFVASSIPLTPVLLRKYFFVGGRGS